MFAKTKIVTPAAATPVTLTEAKAHLRIDTSDTTEDTLITTLLTVASDIAEKRMARALISQTWAQYLDEFPCEDSIEIKLPPLQSITHIKYYDADNTLQTLASSNYDLDIISEPGIVRLSATGSWPSTYDKNNAVIITFVAGYGAASTSVPEIIRAAIKLLISHFFENREGVLVSTALVQEIPIPKAIDDLFGQYSVRERF